MKTERDGKKMEETEGGKSEARRTVRWLAIAPHSIDYAYFHQMLLLQ